jgi:hypothetical protein
MSLSNYLETALLNHAFRGTPFTQPVGLYLALFTAAPGDAGGGTEVSGGGYARQSVAGLVSGDTFTLDANIDFPTASGSWGAITHVGIFDTASGGNLLVWGALAVSRAIGIGDIYRQASLTITLD